MSFRGFLADLQKKGLLKEVHESVSPTLEVTECAWGKGPILFDNVNGHRCCLNLLGTRSLLARALGIAEKDMVSHLAGIGYEGPVREVDSSPFMECVSAPDLSRLPILTYFKSDGGPYITSAVVVSQFEGKDQCLCAPAHGPGQRPASSASRSRSAYSSVLPGSFGQRRGSTCGHRHRR